MPEAQDYHTVPRVLCVDLCRNHPKVRLKGIYVLSKMLPIVNGRPLWKQRDGSGRLYSTKPVGESPGLWAVAADDAQLKRGDGEIIACKAPESAVRTTSPHQAIRLRVRVGALRHQAAPGSTYQANRLRVRVGV